MRPVLPYILILLIKITLCEISHGQNIVSFDSYFFGDIIKVTNDNKVATAQLETSWVEKAEIRTETDEFDIARQRYALRVTPSSKKVNNAINKLKSAYDTQLSILRDDNYQEQIKRIYDTTIDAYKIDSQDKLQQQLLTVLEDQNKVYQKLLDAKNSYAVKWLDVQQEIVELRADILENQSRKALIITSENNIDWSNIKDISTIQESIISLESIVETKSGDIEYITEREIIEKEIELEKAESSTYFDFFQMDYRGPGGDPLNERISLTAAFQLPITGNKSKLKIAELHNKKIELEIEKEARRTKQVNEAQKAYDDINILIEIYNLRKNELENMQEDSKKIIESYVAYNETNPLFLLQQKEMLIKQEVDILNIKNEIIENYIDYLDSKSLLYSTPFNNYLLRN